MTLTRNILIVTGLALWSLTAQARHRHEKSPEKSSSVMSKFATFNAPISYTLGLSVSKSFAKSESSSMQGMDMDREDSGIDPMLMAMFSYKVSRKIGIDMMVGAMPKMGLMDPTIGPSFETSVAKNLQSFNTLTASLPLSKMSKDMYKMTSLTANSSLIRKQASITTFAGFEYSMTWYKQTLYTEESSNRSMGLHGDDEDSDHDHESMNNMDGMSGMDGSGSMAGMNMSDDEMAAAMMADREFSHIGLSTGMHYDFNRHYRFSPQAKLTRVTHQATAPSWIARVTVAEVGYASSGFMNMGTESMPMGFAATGDIALVKSAKSLQIPTSPELTLGIAYGGM